MKVIGAGFPRTGTMSIRAALERLGFGPCYHFITQLERPDDIDVWLAAAHGRSVDWQGLLSAFASGVDWPQSAFYRALMDAYPDAMVLLHARPAAAWYKSMRATVYPASQANLAEPPGSVLWRAAQVIDAFAWQGIFQGRFEDADFAMAAMERWHDEVRATVPPHRLLEVDVRQGWQPLCRFLGVEVPPEPFPHLNDEASFKQRFFSQGGRPGDAL